MRRAGGARLHRVSCRSAAGMAAGHRRLAGAVCRPASRRGAHHRAVGRTSPRAFVATSPVSKFEVWPHAEPTDRRRRRLRASQRSGMLRRGERPSSRGSVRPGRARARAAAVVSHSRRCRRAASRRCPSWRLSLSGEYGKPTWRTCSPPNARRPVVSRAGSGDVRVHAVAGDRERPADRCVGPRRVPRAPRRQAECPHRALERDAVGMERRAADLRIAGDDDASLSTRRFVARRTIVTRYLAPVVAATARRADGPSSTPVTSRRRTDARSATAVAGGACEGRRGVRQGRGAGRACDAARRASTSTSRSCARGWTGWSTHCRMPNDETAAARARVDELETSTTWRMTAPVRDADASSRRSSSRRARARHHRTASVAASRFACDDAAARRRTASAGGARRAEAQGRPPFPTAARRRPTRRPRRSCRSTFAPATAPRVSIVIPVYGKPLLTFTCLRSVHAHTAAGTFEVIVVDDASPEPMQEALAPVTGVRFERNPENLGFIGSCNRGVELARGEFVVLLNNDTIVTEGWLDALLRVFALRAGCRARRREAHLSRWTPAGGRRHRLARRLGVESRPRRRSGQARVQLPARGGLCLRRVPRDAGRAVSGELGGFDERYAPAYYEDTDLAFAVRAAGRRVYYQPDATIVHFEGQTSGTDVGAGVKRHQAVESRRVPREMAGGARDASKQRHASGARARPEREAAGTVRRCLHAHAGPGLAARMRTLAMLELMIEAGAKVTFVARQPRASAALRAAAAAAWRRSPVRAVRALGEPADRRRAGASSISSCWRGTTSPQGMSRRFGSSRRRRCSRSTRSTCISCGPSGLPSSRRSAGARVAARSRRDEELALIRRVDVTIVVSPVERDVLRELAPEARVLLLSNIHEPMPGGRPFAEREGLVFIGGFQHPPNTDGVLWYAREVLPLIRERLPGVVDLHRRKQGAVDDPIARGQRTSS